MRASALARRVRALERRTAGDRWLLVIEKADAMTVDDALAELDLNPAENETVLILNRYTSDASPPKFVSRHPLKAAAKGRGYS